ncbi:MAG: M24 family metallopeptidase [Planctomycetota bacterium]|jgi:Xaa-Pro aminopeptidase
MANQALLMYSDSERSGDMFYATRMFVGDPFLFFQIRGRKMAAFSDLEIGRAKREAKVHRIIPLSSLNAELKKKGVRQAGPADAAALVLKKHRVRSAVVPYGFPTGLAEALRKRGVRVKTKAAPFWESRVIKRPEEVRAIEKCQRANENALHEAAKMIRRSRPRGKRLYYKGEVLTTERVRRAMQIALLEQGCAGKHIVVAGGDQGCDPHNQGRGPLAPHKTIVIDVFPRSLETNYCSDMTRTFCRGKPSKKLRRMYDTVLEGQLLGCRLIKAGARGIDVHKPIQDLFAERGFKTGPVNGRPSGFFHGTGHGIGLEVHEPPRVSVNKDRLRAGMVVTCEPGLYYRGLGAVRIEDMILVGKGRSRNLTRFPKEFVL